MILVGNQRGGARNLARHLMKTENERVEVAQLRGFIANDLDGAFRETYAISKGTRCQQYLFSLSLSPPKGASVSNEQFEQALAKVEVKLGLSGQPRALVYHEKRGDDGALRRHAHAVWSRIDIEEMKAIPLSHSKRKLQDVARDLYLEHGWKMPRGLAVSGERDPRNFTLEQWQQAKMEAFQREVAEKEERERRDAEERRAALKVKQEAQRRERDAAAKRRADEEERQRQARLRTGIAGLWDRIRGERKRQLERNRLETEAGQQRDQSERQQFTATQLSQRRDLAQERSSQRAFNDATVRELSEDASAFRRMEADAETERNARREAFKERRRTDERSRRRGRSRDGPEIER